MFRNGDINLGKVRPTDLKQNLRVNPPMEATAKSEAAIITQQEEVRRCMKDFFQSLEREEDSVLSQEEREGMSLIRKRVKNGEIVISFTDKDGRVVISTPEAYKKAAMIHSSKDEEVGWEEVEKVTVLMNRTSKFLYTCANVG